MVDVIGQYNHIQDEIDSSILKVVKSGAYINGPEVHEFTENLRQYQKVRHVIPCANGTDALQIALMALELKPGDEVIVPSFTFVATAEVIALLGLKPIMVDVDADTFNVTPEIIESAITPDTKAIVPVHLFGQCADMDRIMEIAATHNLYVVEDNAQAIGARFTSKDGTTHMSGTIGHIGTTSFYPSKNLGCYGDGGAVFTNNDYLAEKLKVMANHGMSVRYFHDEIGVNSRLDTIQAAILNIKLNHLNEYCKSRQEAAAYYDNAMADLDEVTTPARLPASTHVFHQYTIKVDPQKRDGLKKHLQEHGIPSMIYYPVPLHKQKAYSPYWDNSRSMKNTETLCTQVLSLPMHTELTAEALNKITNAITSYLS